MPKKTKRQAAPEDSAKSSEPTGLKRFFHSQSVGMRVARWATAIVLTAIGFALGFVPGVPGIPLFAIAVLLIAPDFPPARRLASWFMRKFPRMRRKLPRTLRKRPKAPPAS